MTFLVKIFENPSLSLLCNQFFLKAPKFLLLFFEVTVVVQSKLDLPASLTGVFLKRNDSIYIPSEQVHP